MSNHGTGTFEMTGWDEKAVGEATEAPKLARATTHDTYRGIIEGEGELEYLIVYGTKTTSYFVGVERVTGRIGERVGSFVLQHTGTYKVDEGGDPEKGGGVASGTWSVLADTGTGDLVGLKGEGQYAARHSESLPSYTFNYDFE